MSEDGQQVVAFSGWPVCYTPPRTQSEVFGRAARAVDHLSHDNPASAIAELLIGEVPARWCVPDRFGVDRNRKKAHRPAFGGAHAETPEETISRVWSALTQLYCQGNRFVRHDRMLYGTEAALHILLGLPPPQQPVFDTLTLRPPPPPKVRAPNMFLQLRPRDAWPQLVLR